MVTTDLLNATTRRARQAIEDRARLAEAAAKVARATAELDLWLADIAQRACGLAGLRHDVRFQPGMAILARRRQDDASARPANGLLAEGRP